MAFLNTTIEPSALPDANEASWKPVERAYLTVLRLRWLIMTLVIFLITTLLMIFPLNFSRQTITITVIGELLFVVFYFILQELSFRNRAYAIREHDILYRHGWFIRTTGMCPFNRIQHCSVDSGPIERSYKLASLTLYTAASEAGDVEISGLPEEFAINIREFIMKKIAAHEGTGS
jgi:uncharacterized protein